MIARKSEEIRWESRVYNEVSRLLSALPTPVKLPPCPTPQLQQEGVRRAQPGGNSHGICTSILQYTLSPLLPATVILLISFNRTPPLGKRAFFFFLNKWEDL